VAIAMALQALSVAVPGLAATIGLTSLDRLEWAVVIGLAAVPAVVGQALKQSRDGRARTRGPIREARSRG
jgi:hypothetical protein